MSKEYRLKVSNCSHNWRGGEPEKPFCIKCDVGLLIYKQYVEEKLLKLMDGLGLGFIDKQIGGIHR